jgi:hypothetical protein
MTSLQEGEDEEDITPLVTNYAPHMHMQEPITGPRARRLNQKVSSFPCTFSNYEDGMLSKDVTVLRNNGED